MSLERIFKALVSLGLSQTEVRVYFQIVTKGPTTVRSLTHDSSFSKRQLYRCLNSLQNKSIIVTDNKHPKEFSAIPFEDVLDRLIKQKNEQAQNIRKRKKELVNNWKERRK